MAHAHAHAHVRVNTSTNTDAAGAHTRISRAARKQPTNRRWLIPRQPSYRYQTAAGVRYKNESKMKKRKKRGPNRCEIRRRAFFQPLFSIRLLNRGYARIRVAARRRSRRKRRAKLKGERRKAGKDAEIEIRRLENTPRRTRLPRRGDSLTADE